MMPPPGKLSNPQIPDSLRFPAGLQRRGRPGPQFGTSRAGGSRMVNGRLSNPCESMAYRESHATPAPSDTRSPMNPAPAPEPTGVRPHRSLAWRLILPIPLVVIAGITTLWVLVPRMIVANATEEAAAQGQQIVEQFKAVRTYYTTNVVNKVLKDGTFKAASDHAGNDKAIPLPATMIHDLGALLAKWHS